MWLYPQQNEAESKPSKKLEDKEPCPRPQYTSNIVFSVVFCAVVAYSRHRRAGHYLRGGTGHHEEHQEQRPANFRALMLELLSHLHSRVW